MVKLSCPPGASGGLGQLSYAVPHGQPHRPRAVRGSLHLDLGGVQGQGSDFYPIELDIVPLRRPQLDRAVNARPGVPAGIGLVGIAGNDLQHRLLPGGQPSGEVYIKIGVPVGPEGQLFSVQPDLGVVIDPLKLQNSGFRRQGLVRSEPLSILVVIALIPAGVDPPGGQLGALLPQHGVVRDGTGEALALVVQVLPAPAGIEINGFHPVALLFISADST